MRDACQAASCKPCMIVRLTSINGSTGAPSRITRLEYFVIHNDSEMICARTPSGRRLRSSMQSDASVRQTRRFQSSASASLPPLTPLLRTSIKAPVTWPNSRYSMARGSSVTRCVLWYAFTVIIKPLLFEVEKLFAEHESFVVVAAHDVPADLQALRERGAIADGTHEFGHAEREVVVVVLVVAGIEIHHHDGEIDAARGRLRVFRLHDVLFAQHAGLVLDDKAGALVAVGKNRAVQHEAFAG